MKFLRFFTTSLVIVIVGGCNGMGFGPPHYVDLSKESLERADIPAPEKSRTQVLIMPANSKSMSADTLVAANETLNGLISRAISRAGAQRVDPNLAKDLIPVFERCEMQGRRCRQSESVDVVLKPRFTSVAITGDFIDKQIIKVDGGKNIVTPSRCNYRAVVSVQIEVYDMLSAMELVDTVVLDGSNSAQQETTDSSCRGSDALHKEATVAAVTDVINEGRDEHKIKNYFKPRGHVMSYRKPAGKSGENYFQLSIGSARGAEPGAKGIIYRQEEVETDNGYEVELEPIAYGDIVEIDGDPKSKSWILIKDDNAAARIMQDDLVVVEFECSMMGCLMDAF